MNAFVKEASGNPGRAVVRAQKDHNGKAKAGAQNPEKFRCMEIVSEWIIG